MERRITFAEGEYYHVYNRGVERREIFSTPADHWRFQRLLFLSNGTAPYIFREIQKKKFSDIERQKPLVAIGAYCLMPNHFHILVKEITDNGISMFMEKLATGYSMYFNN